MDCFDKNPGFLYYDSADNKLKMNRFDLINSTELAEIKGLKPFDIVARSEMKECFHFSRFARY